MGDRITHMRTYWGDLDLFTQAIIYIGNVFGAGLPVSQCTFLVFFQCILIAENHFTVLFLGCIKADFGRCPIVESGIDSCT